MQHNLSEILSFLYGFEIYPEVPCTQIVHTLALKYLYRDYIKANVIY